MSIEKDIQQQQFKNQYHKAMVNLIYTYNWSIEQLKLILEREKLTPQQFNILRILRGCETPLSTLQIRGRMLDKMSDTSRIVDRLIIKGLAKKITCKADKRLVDVSITEKGKNILQIIDTYEDEMESILKNLSEEEANTLNILLDKIRHSL
jgi:DNA-binding MarR family transcriptional regulator